MEPVSGSREPLQVIPDLGCFLSLDGYPVLRGRPGYRDGDGGVQRHRWVGGPLV